MRLSVSPEEMANQMIDELGFNQAYRECEFFKNLPGDEKKRRIWCDIFTAINNVRPGEHRA